MNAPLLATIWYLARIYSERIDKGYPGMSHPASSPGEIRVVTVIGAGFLGRQIAAMCAASGREVRLHDVDPNAAREAGAKLRSYLAEPVTTGALDWDLDAVLARVKPINSLNDSMQDTDLMIEAVHEDLDTKRGVFSAASAANATAYLATNSSSIMSAELCDVVTQTDRLVNLHFFSEFWSRSMVELMGCGETSEATLDTLYRFGQSLGLFCAVVRGQSKGFIINRVWRAVKREALRVVDEGHADPEDVDRLWAHFWGIDYGPFGMMDTVGLDIVSDIEDTYIAVSTDPTDRPSRTLRDLVMDGHLGVKSGEGFYRYPHPAFRVPGWPRTSLSDGKERS